MADVALFSRYDIREIIEGHRVELLSELDEIQDSRLLNTDLANLQSYAVQKYQLSIPMLGEPEIDFERTKVRVGRWGGFSHRDEPTVSVDAQSYTLKIPFEGERSLFLTRGSQYITSPPLGTVRDGSLTTTIVEREPSAEALNQEFERFVSDIKRNLDWLKVDIDAWNNSISARVAEVYQYRLKKANEAGTIASGLNFKIKRRSDHAATYVTPIAQRRKLTPQLPAATPQAPPEPILAEEMYRAILDTLKQMSRVMELSPHAYATMDEETLRFQFLVPLNAHFEGEARAEVFNYGGKTDILITVQGRNIFIGECKFWKGAKVLSETVNQVLSYLAWRDTKCAILLFSRNRNFSQVLSLLKPTLEQHPQCVSFDASMDDGTELHFTFKRTDDPVRQLKLTILAFDIPAKAI